MKFLITANSPSFRSTTNESTYIRFCDPSSDISVPLISREPVDVWICNGQEVTSELLDQWLGQTPHIPKSVLVGDPASIPRLQEYSNAKDNVVTIAAFPEQKHTTTIQWEESILRDAEMLYAHARARTRIQRPNATGDHAHNRKTSVLLVGAGIMNLITAEFLATRGYQVRLIDAGPDLRSCKDWTRLGTTSGGHNARMFTNTEADNYNEKGSEIYQNMQSIFRKTVRNGGWSVKPPKEFTGAELAWVDAFERIPAWLARNFKENIYEVNMEAGRLWKEYMKTSPWLFEEVGFCKGILRLYVEQVALDASVKLNSQLGSIIQAPSPEEFLNANPGFRPAAGSDHLSGGITVDGFTLNIHSFVEKLIDRITGLGGEFLWDCKAQSIQRDPQGAVTMLKSQLGPLEADHFVVSPGVTGNELLSGTASENLIQGVLGIWLQIPNIHPQLQHSTKIHRRAHLVEDINITVSKDAETGEDILIFGGGYGYVGLGRPSPDSPELKALFDELEEVARIYFPQGYAAAKERGTMYPGGNRKYCIRPFTPTGLGVFEKIPTASGGQLVITGGNNTGGFAQAPAIARAVWRALAGEHDPIHVLFHPERGRLSSTVSYKSRSQQSTEARRPLRLLLLCSDGPQHRYLRYCLDQAFPGYRCIVETDDGQLRQLVEKWRFVDACYTKYHSLRRYWTGHSDQRKAYFNDLVPQDHVSPAPDLTVDGLNNRQVWEAVEQWQPELTIVSGTKFIGRKLISRAGLMINLHTGHLPDYRGNHCIFFALYDEAISKVSATLHQLTSHLDGGDILDRVFPSIVPGDSEEALYARCVRMAIDRCVEHAERFSNGERLEFVKQPMDVGKTYRHRDRTPEKDFWLWWKLGELTAGKV